MPRRQSTRAWSGSKNRYTSYHRPDRTRSWLLCLPTKRHRYARPSFKSIKHPSSSPAPASSQSVAQTQHWQRSNQPAPAYDSSAGTNWAHTSKSDSSPRAVGTQCSGYRCWANASSASVCRSPGTERRASCLDLRGCRGPGCCSSGPAGAAVGVRAVLSAAVSVAGIDPASPSRPRPQHVGSAHDPSSAWRAARPHYTSQPPQASLAHRTSQSEVLCSLLQHTSAVVGSGTVGIPGTVAAEVAAGILLHDFFSAVKDNKHCNTLDSRSNTRLHSISIGRGTRGAKGRLERRR